MQKKPFRPSNFWIPTTAGLVHEDMARDGVIAGATFIRRLGNGSFLGG